MSPLRRDGQSDLYALTTLSPDPAAEPRTQECLASWRRAGLHVRAFQHPAEIPALQPRYDVEFVPAAETTEAVWGVPLVPVHVFVRWSRERGATVLLLNADIELRLAPWELQRIRWLAEGGLAYLIRHDHDADGGALTPCRWGIDAFLFDGALAPPLPASCLSLGRPVWDYWLPLLWRQAVRPLHAVRAPVSLHLRHEQRWGWDEWRVAARELRRIAGPAAVPELTYDGFARIYDQFTAQAHDLPAAPPDIHAWLRAQFGDSAPKTILELGAHDGSDTARLAALPGAVVHALEPDPRNVPPPRSNVTLHRAAIADRDGRRPLHLSREWAGRPWTHSSSLLRPTGHLARYPVTFDGTVEVEAVTLDTFRRRAGLDVIDFVWADVQGAEGELVRGGRETLAATRYLYTEYSDDELYEGQPTLAELLARLPQFRVVELWEGDVLLENTALRQVPPAPPPQPPPPASPEEARRRAASVFLPTVCAPRPGDLAALHARIPGFVDDDFRALYRRAVSEAPAGAALVEVGVFLGKSLSLLAALAVAANRGLRVHGVDTFRGGTDPAFFARWSPGIAAGRDCRAECEAWLGPLLPHVTLHQAESTAAAETFADGSLWLAWIDGAHDEASVRADLRAWLPKVAPGGWLAGHDWGMDGVRRAVEALLPGARPHGSCWLYRVPEPPSSRPPSSRPRLYRLPLPTPGGGWAPWPHPAGSWRDCEYRLHPAWLDSAERLAEDLAAAGPGAPLIALLYADGGWPVAERGPVPADWRLLAVSARPGDGTLPWPYAADRLTTAPLAEASVDVAFHGGLEAPPELRRRVADAAAGLRDSRSVAVVTHPLYTHADVLARRRPYYAASLAAARFVLCPRGGGPQSLRFYETLAAGRIPVLIADEAALPAADLIPWDELLVRLPEAAVSPDALESALAAYEARWGGDLTEPSRRLAAAWDEWLAPAAWGRLLEHTLAGGMRDKG